MREHHTGLNIFNEFCKLFWAVVEQKRKNKFIGIAIDCAASKTKKVFGAVTGIELILLGDVYLVWCGANQLNLATNSAYEGIVGTF